MRRAQIPSILLVAFAVSSTAGLARPTGSPLSPLEQTRIAAEYGHRTTFVPSWTPPGFRLHSWTVDSGSTAVLPDRLRLRLRRGTSDLIWEVAFAHRTETADRATCERARPFRRIDGRRVYDAGSDGAYICVSANRAQGAGRFAVSVREVADTDDVDTSELRRMVAGARRPTAGALVPASPLVPARGARSLRASFERPVPLPSWMARGFIFTRAYILERSAIYPRTAWVHFGRNGERLFWSVAPTGHGLDDRCTRADRSYEPTLIAGRKVYLARGNKGQSAWTCVREPKRVTVTAWSDYSTSAKTLMRVLASART